LTRSDLSAASKWNSSIEFSKEHYNKSNYVPVIQIAIIFFFILSWLFQRTASVNNHDTIIVSYWPGHLVFVSLQWNMAVNLDQVFAENSSQAAASNCADISQSDRTLNLGVPGFQFQNYRTKTKPDRVFL